MGTTTANMGLSVPTLNGDPGTWDTQLSASLAIIDAHTHQAGSGVLITPAAMNINASLTFANNLATNVKGVTFTAQASDQAALSLYVKSNDVYFRDGASNVVRLTASGALNIATTGGIAGDYITGSASVYYDSAAKTYRMLQAAPAPNNWASVSTGDIDIYEKSSGVTTYVRFSSSAGLGASYTLTLPIALPGSTLLMQVSAAGLMSLSNTIANAVTMTASLSVGTTLGVTGLITASAGVTCAANQHVTLQGTGMFKHAGEVVNVSPLIGMPLAAAADFIPIANASYVQSVGAAKQLNIPLPLKVGDRVTDLSYTIGGNVAETGDFTITLNHYTALSVRTPIGSDTKNNHAVGLATYALTVTDTTLAAGEVVVMEIVCSEADQKISTLAVTYTRP